MLGFSFDGISCTEFDICMKSKNRTLLPAPKLIIEDLPNMDGGYDFSQANSFNRIFYNRREITIDCYFIRRDFKDFRKLIRNIAMWLSFKEARLTFDDEPDVYYMAKVNNKLDLEQQIGRGFFTIVFSCKPFAFSVANSMEDLQCGWGLKYGMGLKYGEPNTFAITEGGLLEVINIGVFVRPKIILSGTFNGFRLEYENSSIAYNENFSGEFIIDCEKMRATLDGNSVLSKTHGEFFEFKNGVNTVQIISTLVNGNVSFDFNYKFL